MVASGGALGKQRPLTLAELPEPFPVGIVLLPLIADDVPHGATPRLL
ncbi:hypothetical protein ABT255_44575 [Streptomyces mirabilis]